MNKQKGMSPIVVLFLLSMLGFAVMVIFKVAPAYMDYATIKSTVNNFAVKPESEGVKLNQFVTTINKQLYVNGINDLDFKEAAYVDKSSGKTVVGFKYEVRKPMISNIDVVLSFEYETPVPRQ